MIFKRDKRTKLSKREESLPDRGQTRSFVAKNTMVISHQPILPNPMFAPYAFNAIIEECPACGWTKREAPQESFTWEELEQLAEEL